MYIRTFFDDFHAPDKGSMSRLIAFILTVTACTVLLISAFALLIGKSVNDRLIEAAAGELVTAVLALLTKSKQRPAVTTATRTGDGK